MNRIKFQLFRYFRDRVRRFPQIKFGAIDAQQANILSQRCADASFEFAFQVGAADPKEVGKMLNVVPDVHVFMEIGQNLFDRRAQ